DPGSPYVRARRPRRQPVGDRPAELRSKLGKCVEPWMKLLLEPSAQALSKNRRGAGGADRNRHLAAVDDGRKCEGAKLGAIWDIDGDAERAGNGRDARVLLIVLGGGDNERPATQLINAWQFRKKRDELLLCECGKLGHDLAGCDINARGALQQQPSLDRGKPPAADYKRRLAVEAHQDGEGPHLAILQPPSALQSGGASGRLSGASSTPSPSSSGVMMIWQQSRERSSTWKAPSSISSSSADGGTSLSSQCSATHTWQVAQAQAPPHSAL